MASIKDLKKRIGTVKNTQQTTRAMKMVSAAKLRRAQDGINNQRPYAHRIQELVETMVSLPGAEIQSPLIDMSLEGEPSKEGKKLLLVLVTSDRGLCGGFNANVIKRAQRWVMANAAGYGRVELGFVGRRGYDFYKTKAFNIGPYYQELGGKVTTDKAQSLAKQLLELFRSNKVDEVKFVFNEFKNAVTQKIVVEDFLPLKPRAVKLERDGFTVEPMVIVRPDTTTVLNALLERHFSIQALRILLESQASEHGARMSAMENATKNAGEMIRKLTLQFNKQRQANITRELLEIISGSESQKG